MNRYLISVGIGLSLVSCDKPDSLSDRQDQQTKGEAVGNKKYAVRREVIDPLDELRTKLDVARKTKSSEEREKAFAEVAWNAIEIDSEIAHEAFANLPAESSEKLRLIQHYAMRLAEQDLEQAVQWAKELETERETAVAMGHIAIQIAEDDPQRAANMISQSNLTGVELDTAVVQVIQRWAANSESDVAGWIVLFSPGAARVAGIKVVTEPWLTRDPVAAFEWLESINDPELRIEATSAMQSVISKQTEDTREAWLSHLSSEMRNELQQELK